MAQQDPKQGRRYDRIATPKGVWVAWKNGKQENVSRVRDLNVGGLYVATPTPLPVGSAFAILLSVPEGEIRSRVIVRNVVPGDGMGVEFVDISLQDAARVENLVARLLRSESGIPT